MVADRPQVPNFRVCLQRSETQNSEVLELTKLVADEDPPVERHASGTRNPDNFDKFNQTLNVTAESSQSWNQALCHVACL